MFLYMHLIEEKLDEYSSPTDLLEIEDTISERDYYINTDK